MTELIRRWIEYIWYESRVLGWFLLPLSWLFKSIAGKQKRKALALPPKHFPVPIIVVGNITVGGTGKTPLVITLIEHLKRLGYSPGVVSRGYGGSADYPYTVSTDSTASQSGDEPLLIHLRCQCPVVVDPDRVAAVEKLLSESNVDIVISDDGLQHYRLSRNIEIAVVDAKRGLGNALCLPAGPLREGPERLKGVDFIIVNGAGDVKGVPASLNFL